MEPAEIVIFQIAHGKIIKAWEEYDEAGMRRQLGIPNDGFIS